MHTHYKIAFFLIAAEFFSVNAFESKPMETEEEKPANLEKQHDTKSGAFGCLAYAKTKEAESEEELLEDLDSSFFQTKRLSPNASILRSGSIGPILGESPKIPEMSKRIRCISAPSLSTVLPKDRKIINPTSPTKKKTKIATAASHIIKCPEQLTIQSEAEPVDYMDCSSDKEKTEHEYPKSVKKPRK